MLDIDAILRPWWDSVQAAHGPLALFDAHTHIGANDPDGFKQTPAELIDVMERADARAIVFPMHEPDGYPGPNDVAIAAAAGSDGRLVSFCRLDPRDNRGGRGAPLPGRGRGRDQAAPARRAVHDWPSRACARSSRSRTSARVPVLIHAGRGIPALGRDTVALSGEFPDARLILAHAAISDLAWLWHVLPEHPNVFIDTAWWNPADLIALFSLVAPSQIVWASDSPYGLPLLAAVDARALRAAGGRRPTRRCARSWAARPRGWSRARIRCGSATLLGRREAALHPLLDRVVTHLITAMGRAFGGGDPDESLALARLSCAVGEDAPHADVCAAVLELLDLYREHLAPPPPGRPFPLAARFVIAALTVARTPAVPLPGRSPPAAADARRGRPARASPRRRR